MKYTAFFDGSSKPNPGMMQIGNCIKDEKENVIYSFSNVIGDGTNNQAEYLALLNLLRIIEDMNLKDVAIYGDSQLVVNQINGVYKVKNHMLIPIYQEIKKVLGRLEGCTITHIYREQNKEADKLTR